MDDTTGRVTPPGAQDDSDARTQEIREEIAQTRIEMSETIEAIQERLTPANLVAQASETVRNATTEKVRQMADTAGYAADQMMDTSVARTIRSNPIPAAMIGIGAAWLIMRSRSNSRSASRRGYGRYRGTRNAYAGGTASGGDPYNTSGDYNTSGAYATGTRDWRVGATSAGAVGTAGYGEHGNAEASGTSRVPELGGEMYGYQRRRSMSFERIVRDNPIVVGAAAALVGVAIGMSVPASETENRMMGETRDTVMDRARDLASGAAEKVQDVAGKAVETVTGGGGESANTSGVSGTTSSGTISTSGSGTDTGGIGGPGVGSAGIGSDLGDRLTGDDTIGGTARTGRGGRRTTT